MIPRKNLYVNAINRESSVVSKTQFQRCSQVTSSFIKRLGLESKLQGHTGCVNCLEWNEKGSLLASGSDDVQVMIWDPFKRQKIAQVRTAHTGNIFSVKFLPQSNDNILVSGAADHKILVHDVEQKETTQVFTCHASRVKRLATAPNVPFLFWSSSEDGTIRQFDLRDPEMSTEENPQNVIVNLHAHNNSLPEAKCLAINPTRTHLLAVGTNDPYVRLYDRRMLSCRSVRFPNASGERLPWDRSGLQPEYSDGEVGHIPRDCVQYYIAGHLPIKFKEYRRKYRNLASTYITFSADGRELLVNMGGEQIYLFDIDAPREPRTFDPSVLISRGRSHVCKTVTESLSVLSDEALQTVPSSHTNGVTNGHTITKPDEAGKLRYKYVGEPLPSHVECIEQLANRDFEKENYVRAIDQYNLALSMCPNSAKVYGNRAAAYLKRKWDGDVYAALRDCLTALEIDSNHLKAHFRLAKCLHELAWDKEAFECLNDFLEKFPDSGSSNAVDLLRKDIETALSATAAAAAASKDKSSSSSSGSRAGTAGMRSLRKEDEQLSEYEHYWREQALDYHLRFCGHCNTTTDIKEANFFGSEGQYVVAGSDDGKFLIWEKSSTNVVKVLKGDESIVNCLQPHPASCVLATSGIEPVVNIWAPLPEDGSTNEFEVSNEDDVAMQNQRRMNADPLEVMLLNMGYAQLFDQEESSNNIPEGGGVGCRTS